MQNPEALSVMTNPRAMQALMQIQQGLQTLQTEAPGLMPRYPSTDRRPVLHLFEIYFGKLIFNSCFFFWPSLMSGGVPGMPTGGVPGMPTGGVPGMPTGGGVPGMPTGGGVPGMPTGGVPGMPTGGVPGMPTENPASSPSSAGTNTAQQQLMQQMLQMFAGGAGGNASVHTNLFLLHPLLLNGFVVFGDFSLHPPPAVPDTRGAVPIPAGPAQRHGLHQS